MHVRSGLGLQYGLLLLCVCSATAQQNPTAAPVQANAIVTVTDHNHHPITGLKAEDFTLYLDGQKQPISSVASDVPTCIGLIIDRSGSMRGRHAAIASAMADFVRASNTDDNFFAVTFNDDPFLEHDFTRDPSVIEQSIASAEARGGTALLRRHHRFYRPPGREQIMQEARAGDCGRWPGQLQPEGPRVHPCFVAQWRKPVCLCHLAAPSEQWDTPSRGVCSGRVGRSQRRRYILRQESGGNPQNRAEDS